MFIYTWNKCFAISIVKALNALKHVAVCGAIVYTGLNIKILIIAGFKRFAQIRAVLCRGSHITMFITALNPFFTFINKSAIKALGTPSLYNTKCSASFQFVV